jgi:hypothetical protein
MLGSSLGAGPTAHSPAAAEELVAIRRYRKRRTLMPDLRALLSSLIESIRE